METTILLFFLGEGREKGEEVLLCWTDMNILNNSLKECKEINNNTTVVMERNERKGKWKLLMKLVSMVIHKAT